MGKQPAIAGIFKLSAPKIVETAEQLSRRVRERFPESGLATAALAVHTAVAKTERRIILLERPHLFLRGMSKSITVLIIILIAWLFFGELTWALPREKLHVTDFVAVLEPFLGSVVFITAFMVFLTSAEQRWKAERVIEALAELRSLMHVVDMHQLTKDPERSLHPGSDTPSSPTRKLTSFELGRYLDYCTELVSLCAKVAALYAQSFSDAKVLRAVDEIETLATGLSTKIWQKVNLLHLTTVETKQAKK